MPRRGRPAVHRGAPVGQVPVRVADRPGTGRGLHRSGLHARRRVSFVTDGGVADNSGASTAAQLWRALQPEAAATEAPRVMCHPLLPADRQQRRGRVRQHHHRATARAGRARARPCSTGSAGRKRRSAPRHGRRSVPCAPRVASRSTRDRRGSASHRRSSPGSSRRWVGHSRRRPSRTCASRCSPETTGSASSGCVRCSPRRHGVRCHDRGQVGENGPNELRPCGSAQPHGGAQPPVPPPLEPRGQHSATSMDLDDHRDLGGPGSGQAQPHPDKPAGPCPRCCRVAVCQ